ncbi:MAG: cytidylate kinase-like family protein [Lachnospiraceae bacterium]|nr:cytidylate kinase-like family protein [Lachnospiraceae bacterium]
MSTHTGNAGQMILSVGREFGSGGHEIAEALASHYGIPLYDRNLIFQIAKENGLESEDLARYDERPRNVFLSRTVNGYSSSMQENLAHIEFDYYRKKAESGESFVIVGRCSETKLKDMKGLISIFVLGDTAAKISRVKEIYLLNDNDALKLMKRRDQQRKNYHNYYCEGKWGDSRNYDLSINSSKLGVEGTTACLIHYIDARRVAGSADAKAE